MATNIDEVLDDVEHDMEVDRAAPSEHAAAQRSGRRRYSVLSEDARADEERQALPWYRRPSPLFLLPGMAFLALAIGATMPSKFELVNLMACRSYSPHWAPEAQTVMPDAAWLPEWLTSGRPLDSVACRHDPKVQSIVGNLIMGLTLITGLLSAMSTAWWIDLSDRYGRARICAVVLLAFCIGDIIFLFSVYYVDQLTIYFILLAGVIEGFGGGLATLIATSNAYCADSTPTGSRSGTFSLVGGCLFAGFGLGPTFGGFVIRLSGGNPVAPYIVSLLTYLGCFVGSLVIPEALSKDRRLEARREKISRAEQRRGKSNSIQSKLFGFLKPLRLLMPRRPTEGSIALATESPEPAKRDLTITCVSLAYAMQTGLYAVMSYKMLYSQYKFGWGPVEVGYTMSAAGGSRVFYLVVVLPILTKLLRVKPEKKQPVFLDEDNEVAEEAGDAPSDAEGSQWSRSEQEAKLKEEAHRIRLMHDSHFDLLLARASLIIETLVFVGFSLTRTPTHFVICTLLQAFGAGTGPSIQSLALAQVTVKESGQILAALSVCQTLMSQVLGPLAFGSLYSATIKTAPEAIFFAASGLLVVATVAVFAVRLRPDGLSGAGYQ